jgi:ankyrin repeat protein
MEITLAVLGDLRRYPTEMNPNEDLESDLSDAIERDDADAILRLASKHSLDGSGAVDAWLSLASRLGNLVALESLLDLATDIDWANDEGETAFSYACAYDQPEAAMMLYSRGANINTVDSSGGKPLDWAICHCHPDFRRWLRSVGGERTSTHAEWPYPPAHCDASGFDPDGG